ncbi:uncharacterized protein N7515_009142 [Penicillium bovifimosum]|uniref:Uncharacterized protein n=1 Tax=Penicillium bovifimosum TaxID=126998 RepID=A0A9W9GJ58_9EURO|nr:uncharacterized protein N7515_009142 [Penicillium bovifimosum]KAJ5121181.1 hypothetical protein N7515_009142 [Penicillium bovifimosum]
MSSNAPSSTHTEEHHRSPLEFVLERVAILEKQLDAERIANLERQLETTRQANSHSTARRHLRESEERDSDIKLDVVSVKLNPTSSLQLRQRWLSELEEIFEASPRRWPIPDDGSWVKGRLGRHSIKSVRCPD